MNEVGQSSVVHVDRLELSLEPKAWPYADANRASIDAVFAEAQRKKPALFNGRVLLMHRCDIGGGVMSGGFMEADYASFTPVSYTHLTLPTNREV